MKPLFAWVGGKQRLTNRLLPLIPKTFKAYHEPFCGSASLFFALDLKTKHIYLNDKNLGIVSLFRAIRSKPRDLYRSLKKVQDQFAFAITNGNAPAFFETKREKFNRMKLANQASTNLACLFLFLIKTSYGGLYRENAKGDFNVSFSMKRAKEFLNLTVSDIELRSVYMQSQQTFLCTRQDFEKALQKAEAGDFVFMDPPYARYSYRGFTKYSKDDFDVSDQQRLLKAFDELTKRGVYVMMTNSDVPEVRKMFTNYLQYHSNISKIRFNKSYCRKGEMIILNYNPHQDTLTKI